MMLDYTITVGNIIEITVIVVGGLGTLFTLRNTVNNLKTDMTDMKAEIKKVGEVLVRMAVADARITNLETDVRDMKHGRGFIQDRASGGINGEYT